jgi:Rad3-related DNA helicase
MPNFPPRFSQEKVLKWMESLPPNIKYILCEIPVGGGKSPIGLNLSAYLANSYGNSFILTPQKILQKQYQDSFDKEHLFSLYGKGNYKCAPKDTNCDVGADLKPRCESCPHRNAMTQAKSSPNIVLNYTLALLLFMLNNELKISKRKLIVFDECHTLEHHLTEFKALQIGEKRCRQFKVKFQTPKNEYEAVEWLADIYKPAVIKEYNSLKAVVDEIMSRYEDGEAMERADAELINKLKDVVGHLDSLNEYTAMTIDEILEKYALIRDKSFFKFKPLYGKELFRQYINPMADRFLFMSSTILDKDAYCRDLGIPPSEAAFISIDSEFELDNRPVIYSPTMKMTYGWDKDDKRNDRKVMISKIMEICETHSDESGVIHTGSFQVASWLIKELQGKVPHHLMHHNPESDSSRDQVIEEFTNNNGLQPCLLISPSVTEGLDLKDDRGRFSIIVKVPYPYLGDNWVKRRQELSKEWYTRQAMIGIIQATGRIVRSKTDWGYNYILDESFGSLAKMYSRNIPKWFKDSIL